MGYSLCLQPWLSVNGTSITVIQNDSDWADLAGFDDAGIYVDIASIQDQTGSSTTLDFETAPSKDSELFTLYRRILFLGATPLGPQLVLPKGWGTIDPLGRFLRWKVTIGTVSTNLHFRAWLNLSAAGW